MPEPTSFADQVEAVVPGVFHWTVQDERIQFRGDAYAVDSPDGLIMIDPLPLTERALKQLKEVTAICITAGQHQRSAWRYRRELGATVYAPASTPDLEGDPDVWYWQGEALPGDLQAILAPGSSPTHHAFLLDRGKGARILFSGDLVMREDDGPFFLLPDYYVEDPEQVRDSVRKVLELSPDILCPAHGVPEIGEGGKALDDALHRASGG